jgi:hypothetical protein
MSRSDISSPPTDLALDLLDKKLASEKSCCISYLYNTGGWNLELEFRLKDISSLL